MKLNFPNMRIQLALGLSAGSALIFEVVATHMLFFYFIESSYSIATVLSVFLFGLAAGSLTIYYFLNRVKNKKLLFAVLQIIIALYAFFILSNLTDILPEISTLGMFLTSFAILLVPTYFLGAIFPLAGSIFKREKKEIIGLVYSSDLFGAILGSLVAGFLLIPFIGAKLTVVFGAVLNLISALIIVPKKQRIIPVLLLFIFLLATINIPGLVSESPKATYEDYGEYQYYATSPYGVVRVENETLYIDQRVQCCFCWPDSASERKLAVFSLNQLESHGDLKVLNIGLGCALTLEKALEYNTIVDVVEINEKVVEANRLMTDVLKNPRVTLIIDDGLNYLRHNTKKYDAILIDIENPTIAHSSNLYTVDAFKIIFDSLEDHGNFGLWSYTSGFRYYDIIYYSLKEAFPYAYLYHNTFLASKVKLDLEEEYEPKTSYEINTIDRNTLTDAYLEAN
jgi:spermidine synthase